MTVFRLCGNPASGFEDAITEITDFSLKFREFKGRYNSMSEMGKFAILIDEKMLARILPENKDSKKDLNATNTDILPEISNLIHDDSNYSNRPYTPPLAKLVPLNFSLALVSLSKS